MRKKLRRIKTVMVVCAILLAFGLAALAGILLFGRTERLTGFDSVTDNYIMPSSSESVYNGAAIQLCAMPVDLLSSRSLPLSAGERTVIDWDSTKDATIKIYKRHADDAAAFRVFNMFPGDSYTKSYFVEVSHRGTVTVRFRPELRLGSEKLAEVLKCKIVLRGENKPLYDGLMKDFVNSVNVQISSATNKTTELTYDITVYLDTSVGNDYMNRELMADFRWWVYDGDVNPNPPFTDIPGIDTTDPDGTSTGDSTSDPDGTSDPSDTTGGGDGEDDGELVSPETGVNVHFCIWFWVAMISIFINLILLRPRRSEKNDEQEGGKNDK